MKLTVISATQRKGVSTKQVATGRPYDISRVSYLVPVEPRKSENSDYQGYGFEVREVDLDPLALHQFNGIKLPAEIDLKMDADPRNPSRNICTGINK